MVCDILEARVDFGGRSLRAGARGRSIECPSSARHVLAGLFRLLDPAAFSTCLTRFAAGLSEASGDGPVALDGKGLRCALAKVRSTSPVALVNAFASASGLALGLVGVPHGTGEIAALRVLLDLLDLRGRTVTADAMHCQRETAQAILDKGADYVLGLKANRFAMYDDAVLFLDDPAVQADTEPRPSMPTTEGSSHPLRPRGRRRGLASGTLQLSRLAGARRGPRQPRGRDRPDHHTPSPVRPVTSRNSRRAAGHRSLPLGHRKPAALGHGRVFDEDRSRARTDNAPLNLAVLRRIALNLAKANTSKGSVRGKIKRAGWTMHSSPPSSSKCRPASSAHVRRGDLLADG